ncbi:MAG: HlyU family transcriptional regulator [Rhodospirillales bacterium]|jgi:hypothetical protein|nr:HlyU family transcriptional regulator [Rhodospirillales bacterium]
MGIGGFLKGLFGGGDDGGGAGAGQAVEYNGYTIHPTPRRQGGQWLTAGVIRKDFGSETKEHAFIRADTFGSRDDAAAMAVEKGKLIIDERGERMFG